VAVREITLCRCNKFDRQKNIEGLKLGESVRLVRQGKRPNDCEEMPMLAFREGGLDIGEVPRTIAASIFGDEHTVTVTGLVQKARWKAPVVLLPIKSTVTRLPSGIERTDYGQQRRNATVQSRSNAPNAEQIALLIIIVIVSLLIGFLKSEMGSSKSVHVRGYTRADGTRVAGYDRAAPGTK
jgi:hypothetical protein